REVPVNVLEGCETIGPGRHEEEERSGARQHEVVDELLLAELARVDDYDDRQVGRALGADRAAQDRVLALLSQIPGELAEHATRKRQKDQEEQPARRPAEDPHVSLLAAKRSRSLVGQGATAGSRKPSVAEPPSRRTRVPSGTGTLIASCPMGRKPT